MPAYFRAGLIGPARERPFAPPNGDQATVSHPGLEGQGAACLYRQRRALSSSFALLFCRSRTFRILCLGLGLLGGVEHWSHGRRPVGVSSEVAGVGLGSRPPVLPSDGVAAEPGVGSEELATGWPDCGIAEWQ